jgi:vitamin B12 transporter
MKYTAVFRALSCAIACAVLLFFCACLAYCDDIELEPITVILNPAENTYSLSAAKNTVFIRPAEKSTESIDKMLDNVAGVDISKRGIFDIQSDMSIRGATFEQSLVSINGVILNDPQTGHHSLDLAFPQAAIDNIEIVRGQSAKVWAQSGIGGAVNISTRKPSSTECEASFLYGNDNTHRASAYASFANEKKGINIAAEESASDGFRPGTDFRQFSVSSSGLLQINEKVSSYVFTGYREKEFGAANFYAPYNSKEWTDTLFLNWQADFKAERFKIGPNLYYRRHHDKFILDRERPDFYLNRHKTEIIGLLRDSEIALDAYGILQAAIDINQESIKSTNLGKDARNRYSYSLIWKNYHNFHFGYDASLRVDTYSEYNTQMLPQAGIYIRPAGWISLRSSASKASRPPSYTDLFYEDPYNKGNENLSPEKAITYEAGADFIFGEDNRLKLSFTLFMRDADNLIDWIKRSDSDKFFYAENITRVKSEGLELELNANISSWLNIGAGYAYINSDIKKREDYISKYALNHPDHKVSAQAGIILPFGTQNISMLYKNRKGYSSYILMGCDLNYILNKNAGIFLTVDNIFDQVYWDIRDNTLPGRQVMAGIKARF